jgi:hypothetical protein
MRKVLAEDQNNGKALEIRLEQEGQAKFYVILAGMTFNLRTGCVSGVCEPTGEDEYMFVENETYQEHPFPNYSEAKRAYGIFKIRYID